MTMSPLDLNFTIFKYSGIWRPCEWSSGWKFWLYNIYTVIVIFLVFTIPLAQLYQLFVSESYNDNFADNIYIMMTMISQCGKIMTILRYRQRIIKLLERLEDGTCKSRNQTEETVQQNFYKTIRFRTKIYGLSVVVTMMGLAITFCTSNIPKRTLPYKMWLPFNVTANHVYGLVIVKDYVSMLFAAAIAIGYDTFVPGIILQTSAQICLLKCRIENIVTLIVNSEQRNELECLDAKQGEILKRQIADCARYHLFIHELANEANYMFSLAILLNYMASTPVLCMAVYKMTQTKLSNVDFVSVMIYTFAVIQKLFMLCHAGSEYTEENQSISYAIYDINWLILNESSKRSLMIMMTRSFRPVIFSCGKIFQVSVHFFVKLVQFSYSAYTCIKQIRK